MPEPAPDTPPRGRLSWPNRLLAAAGVAGVAGVGGIAGYETVAEPGPAVVAPAVQPPTAGEFALVVATKETSLDLTRTEGLEVLQTLDDPDLDAQKRISILTEVIRDSRSTPDRSEPPELDAETEARILIGLATVGSYALQPEEVSLPKAIRGVDGFVGRMNAAYQTGITDPEDRLGPGWREDLPSVETASEADEAAEAWTQRVSRQIAWDGGGSALTPTQTEVVEYAATAEMIRRIDGSGAASAISRGPAAQVLAWAPATHSGAAPGLSARQSTGTGLRDARRSLTDAGGHALG